MSSPPVAIRPGAFANRRTKRESRLWDLYLGEINPLITSKANFWLLFSVTAVIAIIAMPFFYAEMEAYFGFVYAVLPSFTTVFAATAYTRDRSSGFASVVQTVPISNAEYFLAKFLSSMTLGAIFLILSLPFTLLAVYFMGGALLWSSFGEYLLFSIPLMAASTALGLFVSVTIGKRGLLASAMTGFAVTVIFAGASALLRALGEEFQTEGAAQAAAEGNTLVAIVRQITVLAHLSPVVNAIDFTQAYGVNPALVWKTAFTVIWFAVVLSAGSWFIYSRLQNVEGWDCPKWVSIGAVGAVLAVAAAPVFVLDYFEGTQETGFNNQESPPVMTTVRFVDPDDQVDPRTGECRTCDRRGFSQYEMRVGESIPLKAVLVFNHQRSGAETFENVRVTIEGFNSGRGAVRVNPEVVVVPRLAFTADTQVVVVVQPVTVTAVGSEGLGEARAFPQAWTEINGQRYYGSGSTGFNVVQPDYKWYYPLYVLAFMGLVEAAPFVVRSQKIGKRGM